MLSQDRRDIIGSIYWFEGSTSKERRDAVSLGRRVRVSRPSKDEWSSIERQGSISVLTKSYEVSE
jgi:hypothetical protein